ncbi:MAG: hypothetical protein SPF21_03740, partial [Candidatus Methanomethylophilaceae archaeon]|nr:hypothetical protein [Candidatus Methanomethylophilaceae archaeon]
MGTLDSRLFSGAGILSALLFIAAGALHIAGIGSTASYVAAAAGVLALVSSIEPVTNGRTFARKVSGILVALAGFLSLVSVVSGDIVGIVGLVAAVAMVMDALNSWVAKVKGLMIVSFVFAIAEIVVSVMSLIGSGGLYGGLTFVLFGVWIALSIVLVMVLTDSLPVPVSKEKAVEEPKKTEAPKTEPKKAEEPKPKKVEAPKKTEPAKPVRTVEMPKSSKQEPKKTEAPKVEPKKVEPKPQPRAEGPKPASAQAQNIDFMKKLKASKDVHKVAESQPKAESKPVATAVPETPVVPEAVADQVPDVPEVSETVSV